MEWHKSNISGRKRFYKSNIIKRTIILVAQIDSLYRKTSLSKTAVRLISYALFEGRPITTKGRWINPLVFSHLFLEKHLFQLKKVEKPIFIIGTGRSGTTILGVLLSLCKGVGFLNEPKALWHSIYPYEDVLGHYSLGKAHYYLNETQVNKKIIQNAHRLLGAYLFFTHQKRVLDKNPEMIFRIPFIKAIFPEAKFIFLVRNGWDVCHSINFWSERKGIEKNKETHNWWGVNNRKWHFMLEELIQDKTLYTIAKDIDKHEEMAAVEWIITMQEGIKALQKYPDSIYKITYEDLVNQPETSLKDLLDFCELPQDITCINYAKAVLKPAPTKQAFFLPPVINELFSQTLKDLGYV